MADVADTPGDFDPRAVPVVMGHLDRLREALVFIDGLTGPADEQVILTVRQLRILGQAVHALVNVTEATFFGKGEPRQ